MFQKNLRVIFAGLACAALGVTAVGCASSDAQESAALGSEAPLFDLLPERIQEAGVLNVGTSAGFLPFSYFGEDGETMEGIEPDIIAAAAEQLGVDVEWFDSPFDNLFPGLQNGRYDMLVSNIMDTAEREKTYDFASYIKVSLSIVTRTEDDLKITSESDLCGISIGAVRGTLQVDVLEDQSQKCVDEGNSAIQIIEGKSQPEVNLQLQQGRVEALIGNTVTTRRMANESDGVLEVVSAFQLHEAYYGAVLRKDDTELRDAMQQAFQAIIDSGAYAEILEKWGVDDLNIGIEESGINQAA